MLVRRVQEFIKALTVIEDKISEKDKILLHAFQEKYPLKSSGENLEHEILRNVDESLSEEELSWIQEYFSKRWLNIADTPDDYTFDSGGINAEWVALAKDLAAELQKPYLLVLIPVLTNHIDPDIFSHLDQLPDARSLYLSDDGKTWRRVKGLFDRLQQPTSVFSTFDMPKEIKPRSLTLKELLRIRSKRGEGLSFSFKDETYSSFWNYVMKQVAPTWQKTGEYPLHLLSMLLNVVEDYCQAKTNNDDLRQFHQHLDEFAKSLATCPVRDVNHLYGIPIRVQEKTYYLIEILLDCFQDTEDLHEKLKGVAQWLCRFDPSLISKHKDLEPIYKTFNIGNHFNATHLRKLVANLDIGDTRELKPLIEAVLQDIDSSIDKIEPEVIRQIKDIYAKRWGAIIDTPNDYTRMQNNANRGWIRLAQHLAGAGYIETNYYKLLIPTLKHDTDLVTCENLIAFPLSHFILSDNGAELIYLPNCVNHHKANGTFYNCTHPQPRHLSQKELARLPFAAPQFHDYFLRVVETEEDPAISKRTVEALRALVNGSLNPVGLLAGHDISKTQQELAEKAYADFLEYLAGLPEDELARLYKQKILFHTKQVTFAAVMENVQLNNEDDRECIAVFGQYLAKLVVDYDPTTRFRKEIERHVGIDDMRQCSAKKVYREYDGVDAKEATRRVLTIFVSLMTHSFSYLPFTGTALRVWDHTNTTTETGKELFKALELAIELGEFKQIRFIYASLIEKIIKPAVAETDFITKCTRYDDTFRWLKTLEDGSMFKPENTCCFDPELLLTVLAPLVEKSKSRLLVEKFLDQLIQTLMQPQNAYLKWIRINIEFNKLLNDERLSTQDRTYILSILRQTSESVKSAQFTQSCMNFLVHRAASLGARDACKKQAGLFGSGPGQYRSNYNEITKILTDELSPLLNAILSGKQLAVSEIANSVKEGVKKSAEKIQSSMIMLSYLQEISRRIPAMATETRSSYSPDSTLSHVVRI